ncbi:hypothetical protein [uncultured Faecalibaculum sp.]|uniref:hypothetical protein n=1 Tax=uncultured Faecalibaculum sp. TaxID=1729681 RepID=UPI0026111E1F|nr:hypothetical protein [uncultured Faecalibaculum sp.]
MNQSQYEVLEEKILTGYARIPYMPLRLEALRHTLRVVDMISLLDTDTDLWDRRSAALLHDTGRFLKNSPGMRQLPPVWQKNSFRTSRKLPQPSGSTVKRTGCTALWRKI